MSRSGYSEDCGGALLHLYRGAVESAIRGARGQALLRDLLTALDAMPVKRLIGEQLINEEGEVCALGACGRARGMDVSKLDPYEPGHIARAFNIARALACEISYMNDEWKRHETPEECWTRMRAWVASQIREESK